VPTLKNLATTPFRIAARMADVATGQDKVDIDTTYEVEGKSAQAWADQFEKNPSRISPVATGHVQEGEVHKGQPFPLGPDIGIEIKDRTSRSLSGGRSQVTLEVMYSGDFEGPGKITITEQRDGTLRVRDEWNDVANKSMLPTLAARMGHPAVAGLGIQGVAARARGDAPLAAQEIAKGIVDTSVSLMTAPFRFFLGG
jgi:hypothetical protein